MPPDVYSEMDTFIKNTLSISNVGCIPTADAYLNLQMTGNRKNTKYKPSIKKRQ